MKSNLKIPNLSSHVLFVTLPLHLLLGAALYWLVQSKSFHGIYLLWTLLGWTCISGLGVAVGYHRYFSHHSFVASKNLQRFLALCGALGAQGSPQFWMAVHIGLHHRYAEKEKDVHSPIHGFFSSYFGWQLFLDPKDVPFRLALSLQADPFMRFLHRYYKSTLWGILLVAAILNIPMAIFLFLIPMVISIHQENLVNSLCHYRQLGYRNFDTPDNSVNNWLIGILTFGQGFHNNHHAHPLRADFGSERWYEVDPSLALIKFITWLDKLILSKG